MSVLSFSNQKPSLTNPLSRLIRTVYHVSISCYLSHALMKSYKPNYGLQPLQLGLCKEVRGHTKGPWYGPWIENNQPATPLTVHTINKKYVLRGTNKIHWTLGGWVGPWKGCLTSEQAIHSPSNSHPALNSRGTEHWPWLLESLKEPCTSVRIDSVVWQAWYLPQARTVPNSN